MGKLTQVIFICSPYKPEADDPSEAAKEVQNNIKMARLSAEMVTLTDDVPLAPVLYFNQFLRGESNAEKWLKFALHWLDWSDELWVVGHRIDADMVSCINRAKELDIPIKCVQNPETTLKQLMDEVLQEKR